MKSIKKKDELPSSEKTTVDYKIRVMRDAHLLATSVFPRQITELDELLRSLKTATAREPSRRKLLRKQYSVFRTFSPLWSSHTSTSSPRSDELGLFKCSLLPFWDNSDVISLHTKISPLIQNMADHCILVRSWMLYLCSRKGSPLELRTTLQADVLETLLGLESFCQKTNNILSGYLSQRSSLLEKCSAYPDVHDYKYALVDLDDGHYRKLHNVTFLLRDSYITFLNRLLKTFERIRRLRRVDGSMEFLRYL